MAKPPQLTGPSSPEEFPQVPPAPMDLHATSDIRFVMREVAKLDERVANLIISVGQIENRIGTAIDKMNADLRERIGDLKDATASSASVVKEAAKSSTDEIKVSLKEFKDDTSTQLKDIEGEIKEFSKKVAFVKGAVWVLGALFALVAILLTALARKWVG